MATASSFTGRSALPAAWSILDTGVFIAANRDAGPRVSSTPATIGADPPPYSREAMGSAKAVSPKPAGAQTKAVTLSTDSIRSFSWGRSPRAQASVTAGRALMPMAWVSAGTSRYRVIARV